MAIEFEGVSFAYPNGSLAVDTISFGLAAGERLAIVGQNGAGKTTTVKLMNGLYQPACGRVVIDGIATTGRTTATVAETVGYVFQNPDDQIFSSTVRAELEYLPRYRRWDEAKRRERVDCAAAMTGIAPYLDANPSDLPLVMRKFVAIAAILVSECRYVILDEPTAGLDRPGLAILSRLIERLEAAGVAVVTITHDMRFVAENFARVIAMAERRVVFDGTCRALFGNDDLLRRAKIRRPELAELARSLRLPGSAYQLQDIIPLIPDAPEFSQTTGKVPVCKR
ncbi:ABC transporter ATP-binding protein [Mesorhizobium sp. B2-3-11]|uniref:energy-coupling factor ABC transporter ATP-binding protein n=1 Tax=Mesorhizobium sp. B2-3-11 TaxID=2589953 RepID=UPI00112C50E0|nr:ABC transporter ATP-binding protein [Mesorhizobium sp. B2-3-11]TPM07050.1 ABC transporter ATP-binding protein [Mesorhizobium sp. B2-3-11]